MNNNETVMCWYKNKSNNFKGKACSQMLNDQMTSVHLRVVTGQTCLKKNIFYRNNLERFDLQNVLHKVSMVNQIHNDVKVKRI